MSEVRYHIDWETFSKCPIKLGAYRYAEDPSTEILLGCVARGNNRPRVWDYSNQGSLESLEAAVMFKEIAENPEAVVYAHNSQFEWAISKHLWQKTFWLRPPRIEQFRCTMAMARRTALPSSLGELGKFLKLPFQKDKAGEWLIKIFCVPRTAGKLKGTRITPDMDMQVTLLGEKMSVKDAWRKFKEYCLFDVLTEREVEKVLKPFDLEGETLEAFLFDARMNDRGIPVNREALVIVNQKINEYQSRRAADFKCLTGLEPSQTAKVLAWLRERGYKGENLQAATMEEYIETPGKMSTEALEALRTRSEVSYAAVKKIPTMLASAGKDGMVRGGLLWSGAERTHRWSGRIIQPQNFKRPTIKDTADAYAALCRGMTVRGMEMIWGPFLETSASCIRHFIQHPEHHFLDSDYANIEARITPWVSGQDSLVDDFRTLDRLKREGAPNDLIKLADPYVKMAAIIFDTPAPDIVDDERFVGKQAILGCGFQCGWEKFQFMCKGYGRELEDELCQQTVKAYRDTNDKVASMWNSMQQAAISAIENPKENFVVRGRITFGMAKGLPYKALVMKLPSGHFLVYPEPSIRPIWILKKQRYSTRQEAQRDFDILKKMGKLEEKDRVWETKEISFYGPDENGHWCRQTTYGGKLLENSVQAIAGDFITHGLLIVEKKGYNVFMLVHDQTLALNDRPDTHSPEHFKNCLCTVPRWAAGFPLDASVAVTPYYQKG